MARKLGVMTRTHYCTSSPTLLSMRTRSSHMSFIAYLHHLIRTSGPSSPEREFLVHTPQLYLGFSSAPIKPLSAVLQMKAPRRGPPHPRPWAAPRRGVCVCVWGVCPARVKPESLWCVTTGEASFTCKPCIPSPLHMPSNHPHWPATPCPFRLRPSPPL